MSPLRTKKAEAKSTGWLGGMLKSAATFFVAKDNYEDMVESTKSTLAIKHAEFAKTNICAMNKTEDLVPLLL